MGWKERLQAEPKALAAVVDCLALSRRYALEQDDIIDGRGMAVTGRNFANTCARVADEPRLHKFLAEWGYADSAARYDAAGQILRTYGITEDSDLAAGQR